jgi:hypothetical protein
MEWAGAKISFNNLSENKIIVKTPYKQGSCFFK